VLEFIDIVLVKTIVFILMKTSAFGWFSSKLTYIPISSTNSETYRLSLQQPMLDIDE